MANIKKLDLDIDDVREKLEIVDNRQITFPEIICHKILETNISKWIAFLLDPEQNRYALQFLNVFLKQIGIPECRSKTVAVYNECILDVDSRIDVYITTPEYIIGIEMKLTATETSGDQTERYHDIITQRCQRDHKKPVEIYLKPSSNTDRPKCDAFQIIAFKDILPALHILSESLPLDREHFILDELIGFLEIGPERARSLSLLSDKERKQLDDYHNKDLYKDMTEYLAAHEYIKIKNNQPERYPNDGLGFMQLKRKGAADWKQIKFHYEILWTESHYLALNKKVVVAVHLLENSSQFSKSEKRRIMDFFYSDLLDGKTLFSKEIKVDFTSIKKSHESLDKIIKILDSEEVVQLGENANECINKLYYI